MHERAAIGSLGLRDEAPAAGRTTRVHDIHRATAAPAGPALAGLGTGLRAEGAAAAAKVECSGRRRGLVALAAAFGRRWVPYALEGHELRRG
jgi:hypothetical protein